MGCGSVSLTAALESYLGHKRKTMSWIAVHHLAISLSHDLVTSLGVRLHDRLTDDQAESLATSVSSEESPTASNELHGLFDEIEYEVAAVAEQIGQLALDEIGLIAKRMGSAHDPSSSEATVVYLELRDRLRDDPQVKMIGRHGGELINLTRLFMPEYVDDTLGAIFDGIESAHEHPRGAAED